MTDDPVILFTLRECPQCEAARAWLRGRGVPFVERDIHAESGAIEDLTKLTGASVVPTVVVGQDVQIGWDEIRVSDMITNPLPPEEEDRLLASIEAATEPDGPDPDS